MCHCVCVRVSVCVCGGGGGVVVVVVVEFIILIGKALHILANPPGFPGKIPGNPHYSRGPGDFKQTPGKVTVLSDTGFS